MSSLNIALPLVVAVTGHRDVILPTEDLLKEKVKAILKYLRKTYPSTPILFMSALAEGADRLAAEAVLELKKNDEMIKLMAPLPLDIDEYKKDFPESAHKFDELLDEIECFELSPYAYKSHYGKEITVDDISLKSIDGGIVSTPARNAQYANLGAFLARHCNILIALWDGRETTNTPGGTSNVVNLMLDGYMNWGQDRGYTIPARSGFEKRLLSSGGETGAVFHIPVQRKKSNGLARKDLENNLNYNEQIRRSSIHLSDLNVYYRAPKNIQLKDSEMNKFISEAKDEFEQSLEASEEFNKDLKSLRSTNDAWLPLESTDTVSESITSIKKLFIKSDSIAAKYQKKTELSFIFFFTFVAISTLSFEIFGSDWEAVNVSSGFYLLKGGPEGYFAELFAISSFLLILIKWWVSAKRYSDKFHAYRALTECLRISYYMSYLDIHHRVAKIFLQNNLMSTPWITNVINFVDMSSWKKDVSDNDESFINRVEDVRLYWIEDQKKYFNRKITKTEKRIKALKLLAGIFSVAAFILLVSLLSDVLIHNEVITDLSLIAVFLTLAALFSQWREMKGYEEDIERFRLIEKKFRYTQLDISNALNEQAIITKEHLREIFIDLAHYALQENQSWYYFHQSKNLGMQTNVFRKVCKLFRMKVK